MRAQVGVREGVVLLTYSSLISAADSGASRLQQLVDWAGPGFEGLIVFDGTCTPLPFTPVYGKGGWQSISPEYGNRCTCWGFLV